MLQEIYHSNTFKNTDFKKFVDGLSATEKRTLSAGEALKNYNKHLQTVGKTTAATTSAMSSLKSIGGSILSTFGNMAISFAVFSAISAAIKGIDNYIHKSENLIKAGEEVHASIQTTYKDFSEIQSNLDLIGKKYATNADDIISTGDAIGSIAEKYSELSDGVDKLSNKNNSLSSSDYEAYLDISNQLAQQMPSLVSGYDANGNAILNLGNNAANAAQSLTELYEAEMLAANVKIGDNLDADYKGIQEKIKQSSNNIKDFSNELDQHKKIKGSLNIGSEGIMNTDIEFDPNAFGKQTAKVRNEIESILKKHGVSNPLSIDDDGTAIFNTDGISKAAANEISNVINKYKADAIKSMDIADADIKKKISNEENNLKAYWGEMSESVGDYLKTSKDFTGLNKDLQNAFLGNLDSINPSAITDEYDNDVSKFIDNDLIKPLADLKPEAQNKLADLLSLDPSMINIGEYKSKVSNIIKEIFPDNKELQEQMTKNFGFDDVIKNAEDQLDVLTSKFGDSAKSLTLDELQTGYDLIVNDGFTGTFDQFKSEIEKAKQLAATSINLKANTNFDAIIAADETANAGDDYVKAQTYLKEAKEMLDKGLIGTDDFKTRAAYFSPTGADDPVNFAENYATAARYLTEDSSGVVNFLNDLSTKTNDAGQALASFDESTGKWTYNINDLQQASKDMGIGFEFMMDMFGRLEDYGFSNNFVGSIEDGTARIAEKTKELAEAEAELARLQSEDADTTAITQQQEKVNALKNDINETRDAMGQLVARSGAEYAEQVSNAKEAIGTLNAERQKILSENTYGEDTKAVADQMEEQIRQWASENHLELDADLNVVNKEDTENELNSEPIKVDVQASNLEDIMQNAEASLSKVQELVGQYTTVDLDLETTDLKSIDDQILAVKWALQGLADEDGTININTEGVDECLAVMDYLFVKKNELSSGIIMQVDTSGLDDGLASAISTLQEFQNAYNELQQLNVLKSSGVNVDTSEAEAKLQELAGKISGFDADTKAKLGLDTSEFDSALASVKSSKIDVKAGLHIDDSAISTLQASIAAIDNNTIKTVTGQTVGKSQVDALKESIDSVKDKNVNIKATTSGKTDVDNLASSISSISSKSATVTIYRKTVYSSETEKKPKATGTMLSPARANGTAYNVLNYKPTYANGKIALSRDEHALVNELGTESIIRNGVWSLIPGGMHTQALKKGDIVLSASQTKMLLETGRAIGHGKAYAGGSGGGYNPVLNGGSYGGGGTSNSNSAPSSNNSSSNTSDQTKEFNEKIDEIEILLDRMEKSFERLTDSIETYSYDLTKQSEVSTQAMNQIRTNLGTLQQAYNRYIQEANSVGLDESWKKRIENGSINISEITDKDLKEKIDEFQKWFNKATDVQDKIAETQKELLDLAVEKLDNIEKYFENRTDYNDNFGYLTPITLLQESLDKFTKELEKQVNDGVIKEGSNEWYESMESISKMQEKILEATLKKYQDIIDNLSRISDTLDNSIELKEARDEPILESDYSKQIDLNNKSIQEKYNKRQQLLKQQAIYDVGSAKYDEIAEEIADIDDDIYGLLTDIEELKDKIWEVRWQPFFDGQEALKDLIDETDTFRDLLDSDAFVGKNGGLTADGITNIALISSAMNEQKQSIKNYSAALEKLQEDYDKGNISAKEFKETSKEFMDEIASGVSNVEKYKDEIVSLYEEMLEKENDVVQKSIQKHEKLLDIRKKNDSYSRNVKKQVKDINLVQAQLAALSGTNNQEALKQKKLLETQLKEMQDELSETQKDREYDIRQSGYDNLSSDLTDAMNETLDAVKYNSSKQEEVISEMLDSIVQNYQTAYDKINQIIGNTGFKPSDDFQQNIGNLGTQTGAENQVQDSNTIAPNYKPDDFVSGTNTGQIQSGSSQSNNDKIESEIEKEPNTTNRPVAQLTLKPTSISIQEGQSKNISVNIRPTDAANKTLNWKSSNDSVATVSNGSVKALKAGSCKITASTTDGSGISATVGVTVTAKPKPKPPAPKPSSGDGVIRVGDKVTFTGNYYSDSWGGTPLGNLYAGVPGGVVVDAYSGAEYGGGSNFHGGYAIHIKSADGRYGDLGWVMPSQISGYAKGTRGIKKDLEFAKINELGNELVIRRGGNDYTTLTYGSAVVPHDLSDKLFTLAKHTDQIINASVGANGGNRNVEVNNHYDSVITVNGNVDKDVMPRLERDMDKLCQQISKRFYKDAGLMGIQKKL